MPVEKEHVVKATRRELVELYRDFGAGQITRRDFMLRATQLGVAGAAASLIGTLASDPVAAAERTMARKPLDIAEWSYFWLGVKRAKLARGTVTSGEQMYVEYQIPANLRHPYPIVLVHGGGGQGTDWMGTPDGRPGWFQYLLEEGYAVYVVDRPGHARVLRRAVHAAERSDGRSESSAAQAHAMAGAGHDRVRRSRSVRCFAGWGVRAGNGRVCAADRCGRWWAALDHGDARGAEQCRASSQQGAAFAGQQCHRARARHLA
jgi:pimeloyl-ACP methyl ester carboxylesterase